MLRNCAECNQLFVSSGNPRCRDCLRKVGEDLDLVRSFLREEPDANIERIVAATEVTRHRVLEFIQQGRLVLKQDPKATNETLCSICKTPIEHGQICSQCQAVLGGRKASAPGRKPKEERRTTDSSTSVFALRRRRGQ